MLRSEHSIVTYDFAAMTVRPDRLLRGRDNEYLSAVGDAIAIYRGGTGCPRGDLHRAVADRIGQIPGCPPRRIASFCKLLDDASSFASDSAEAVALRRRVFESGAAMHPIVEVREGIFEYDLAAARERVGREIGLTWPEIEARLFADVIELQPLLAVDQSVSAGDLLSTYNVAQTQAALYKATRVRVDAWDDFKTIVRHAKLARLMHRIDRIERPRRGYRFILDGPGSTLRTTSRYGIGFAKLLTKLLACKSWHLTAWVIGPKRQTLRMTVSPKDRLRTPISPPDEFDSDLERDVQTAWHRRPVEGWTLESESELLHRGQTVLTPDFALRHRDGRLTHLEVVGYWTPEYLAEKIARLRPFVDRDPRASWLLMFPKSKKEAAEAIGSGLGIPAILFDKRSDPNTWIDACEQG